jgi:hypothetical protein
VNSLIRVAHAFTCFQLTELVRRVPKTLERFSADVLIVTALPDLYFDEDVRDREARASFEHALEGLGNVAPLTFLLPFFPTPHPSRPSAAISFSDFATRRTTSRRWNRLPTTSFPLPREKYSAAFGLNGMIKVHYGQNRPYFCSIDPRCRRALEEVPPRLAAGND